ncbi:hypothetical protein VNO80_04748 [Phaseolus coccineus]|uniref:Uncharacterized protein n=1 Tax=Phaseolus coccineus TaxID=3886 RepID=A0AAN9NU85_PHACN
MFLVDYRKTFPHYASSFEVNVFDTRNCHHLTSNGKDDSCMYFDVQVSILLWFRISKEVPINVVLLVRRTVSRGRRFGREDATVCMPKVKDQYLAQEKSKSKWRFCVKIYRKFRLTIPAAAPWVEREAIQYPAER